MINKDGIIMFTILKLMPRHLYKKKLLYFLASGFFPTKDMQTPPSSPLLRFDPVFMDHAECAE